LTGADVNAMQIERVCHKYGQWIEDADNAVIEDHVNKEIEPDKANEVHYVSVDGAMYLTREDYQRVLGQKFSLKFRNVNYYLRGKIRKFVTHNYFKRPEIQ